MGLVSGEAGDCLVWLGFCWADCLVLLGEGEGTEDACFCALGFVSLAQLLLFMVCRATARRAALGSSLSPDSKISFIPGSFFSNIASSSPSSNPNQILLGTRQHARW